MTNRRLGRTGLLVSEISLGTVELGMAYGIQPTGDDAQPSYAEAERLLHRALDLGVNYIDTARAYGDSEAIIGRALGNRRHEFILASKVQSGAREVVEASVHASLRALATDVIDVMMIHSAAAEVILRGEVLEVLAELRKEGCLRFLGASVYGEEAALAAIESDHYDCVQIAYSLLDRRPELRVMPAAEASDVGIVVRSVLLKGALTPRYRLLPGNLADLKRAAHQMEELAGNRLPELAYRYVLAHPATDTALVGTGRVEELEAAVRFARLGPLPDEILSQIRLIDVEDVSQLNPGNWGIA